MFSPDHKPVPPRLASGDLPGFTLMVDGIALEERCRYLREHDAVVGLCREHAGSVKAHWKVTSLDAVKAIEKALETHDCCHGKEATVVALVPYARHDKYSAIPLLATASCKQENAEHLAEWLENVIETWHDHPLGERIHGPIKSLATDGDSTYRKAKRTICMKKPLDPNSALGRILYQLPGLNCFTGKDSLTATCDPKHVIKRE